jgi:hypothetical protein
MDQEMDSAVERQSRNRGKRRTAKFISAEARSKVADDVYNTSMAATSQYTLIAPLLSVSKRIISA